MMIFRSSWVSAVAAAGIGVMTLTLVVGLLEQILPTLPKLSLSLAWIPGLLAGMGATYGAWSTLKLALRSDSWADFRALLLETWMPFDPAEHGGKPRQPVEDLRPEQIAQEIRQTQLRHQKILNRIKQQVQAEIQLCERAQAQLRSEQQRCQALQAQAQQLQQYLQTLPHHSPKSNKEQQLRQKFRQLQSEIITLKTKLERQGLQLQQSETERAQLQQQQQQLKRLLHRTKAENQELRSQQEHQAKQLEQTQQELQALQTFCRALKVLQEVEASLPQSNSA